MAEWWNAEPIIDRPNNSLAIVREDLIEGGSKIRFLPYVVGNAQHIVYGGPFCGGAPYALSVWGKRAGVRVTLFYAKRRDLHWRQKAAFRNGATIYQVPAGRMTVVQHRARAFAAAHGALFLPLGFDTAQATEPFVAFMRRAAAAAGPVDQVWCATGSGMLARCLGEAFPNSEVMGVAVGLKSRHGKQDYPANVRLLECAYDFAEECPAITPFPACRNYETKAWEQMQRFGRGRRLFWNVVGTAPSIREGQQP